MTDPAANSFEALGLTAVLCEHLASLGYEEPTPIQRAAIPPLLEGRDLLGQAATGTGKTAAFGLPLLQRLQKRELVPYAGATLILVPTRELAMQVKDAISTYARPLKAHVVAVYGGQDFTLQKRALRHGAQVVVATPGRALDHIRRRTLVLDHVEMVVLDEADEMLDQGFAEDLDAILSAMPKDRQTALFSATMPTRIADIAKRHLKNPLRLQMPKEKSASGEEPKVRQAAYVVTRAQKIPALVRVLKVESPRSAIVFCRTREEVDGLSAKLGQLGMSAEPLHGGMSQQQRDRVVQRLKSGGAQLLIATDVAARGLHVEKLSHVVNFDMPTNAEVYVHRIGRTGRAGQDGVALSLIEPKERRLLRDIEKLTRQRVDLLSLPTTQELEARRGAQLKEELKEILEGGGLERYRQLVEVLTKDIPLEDLAAAALKSAFPIEEPPELALPPAEEARGPRGEGRGSGERFERGSRGNPESRGPRRTGADAAGPARRFGRDADGAGRPPRGSTYRAGAESGDEGRTSSPRGATPRAGAESGDERRTSSPRGATPRAGAESGD
jgi:ATP-dependent RNA helicase DeaD